ncbi:MAG: hypothetical protein EOO27_23955 [Comamonadaceae bacterium]|nr:MAG: hypothetical protein EOO27_23955 [Comamonadaceae bacterium]
MQPRSGRGKFRGRDGPGLERLQDQPVDLGVLDAMLPKESVLNLCPTVSPPRARPFIWARAVGSPSTVWVALRWR